MATRKKKAEVTKEDEFFDLVGYTAGSVKEAKVVKGNHLTVTTYPDGRTELEWDDDALLQEVREALASVENTTEKPKRSRKKSVS